MRKIDEKIVLAPTDLSNFSACRHSTQLDLQAANGLVEKPNRFGPVIEELQARGIAHELSFLKHLESLGHSVHRFVDDEGDESPLVRATGKTMAAMKEGHDYIYQATLADDVWSGRADFLMKVEVPSDLGTWSYEVIDTKLARDTRAGTILQLCIYSYLLSGYLGTRPSHMHVVSPGNDFALKSYRLDDYGAYCRFLERGIGQSVTTPEETYPELVTHCDFCAWWSNCEKRRRVDDHLCYVAGIRANQIKDLRSMGVDTLTDLAQLENVPLPSQGSREALVRARDQAALQLQGRVLGEPVHKLIEPVGPDNGLALLPEPTEDDIFLDFEGNHFVEDGVSEYLTGFLQRGVGGKHEYVALWALSPEEERLSFERVIDTAMEVLARNPDAHIYHFAPYETTALKRLMGRYATREIELDRLLRGGAFVDLYAVVKRALVASVERYSIKDLEPFFGYKRTQDLAQASMSRRLVEHAMEVGEIDAGVAPHLRIVEDYNREDCESTQRLQMWLEELRTDAIASGAILPRPPVQDGEASDEISVLDLELQRLRDSLLSGVPDDPSERTEEQQAYFTLAHMMEFHRREEKAGWWEFFRVRELEITEYSDERRAMYGLELQEVIEDKRAPLQRYRYPTQDLDVRKNDDVYDSEGGKIGAVANISFSEKTIDIKKKMATADHHPLGIVFHKQISSRPLRESLMRLGESVLERGFSDQAPYRAALELLLRRSSPLGKSGLLQSNEETTVEAASRLAQTLDGHVLAIQGPPGTGKTYTGANVICQLIEKGLRVGVTAVSHRVIENLLEGAMEEAQRRGLTMRAVHCQDGEYEGKWGLERQKDYPMLRQGLLDGNINVLGGTAWCWVREDFEQSVDVLVVDEAGQMSLSNVLAASPGGRGLVLLGDPQQLEQPLQSSHPEGSEVSSLQHFLDGEDTMPMDKGLFLSETYRLHPHIARFTSEVYYEGKVSSRPGLENQLILASPGIDGDLYGSGLRYVPVLHSGNQARSLEEVCKISGIVQNLLAGGRWQDKEGNIHALTEEEILIVAPYNAQVAALNEALPTMSQRIGTVDRFQGQEAPIVIYSMTSSTPEDAPRGMSFLYDPHRFNVATSRALALCILVGCPDLFEPECRTPQQMARANGFCRYLELAQSPCFI
jgi:predicted RecB family nuclease